MNIKVGTRLKYKLNAEESIDCEILFINSGKYERPYLVKYDSPNYGWHITKKDDIEIPHDIVEKYLNDETVSFLWLSKQHLLNYSDICEDEQENKNYRLKEYTHMKEPRFKVGTQIKTINRNGKMIKGEIIFVDTYDGCPYLVKYNDPDFGWKLYDKPRESVPSDDIYNKYVKDKTCSFGWKTEGSLLKDFEIVDNKKKYVPALGDFVKIKRDEYAEKLTGMIGQIFMMFADDNNTIILLRVKKGCGWNIETRKNYLPPRFYYKYSGDDDYNFWWTNLDNVEFVEHGKIDIKPKNVLPTKEDLLKALDTISKHCCYTNCNFCEIKETCDKCANADMPLSRCIIH